MEPELQAAMEHAARETAQSIAALLNRGLQDDLAGMVELLTGLTDVQVRRVAVGLACREVHRTTAAHAAPMN